MSQTKNLTGMESKAARGKVSLVIKTMKKLGAPASSNLIKDSFNSTYRNGISMNELTQLLAKYSRWFRKTNNPTYSSGRTTTWALKEGYDGE